MLVSFIIPAYNAAGSIVRCLDSICALPLEHNDFEVIVIDDCSTDNTCAVVEQYIQSPISNHQYPITNQFPLSNLLLLKQPSNNRQGAARNRGISVANGEYICFVDSDDTVAPDIVNAILLAKAKQTDMTAFHYENVDMQGNKTGEAKRLDFSQGELFSGLQLQNNYSYWCSAPWGYVYAKSFLDRVAYPFAAGFLYEDADFVMRHLYQADRMAYCPDCGYRVWNNTKSTTRRLTYKNSADFFLLGVRMLALYDFISINADNGTSQKIKHDSDHGYVDRSGQSGANNTFALKKAFAQDVLEGACYNMNHVFGKLHRLNGWSDVTLFYERIDAYVSRRQLYADRRLRTFYWNIRTSMGLKHKYLTTIINAVLSSFYRLYMWTRHHNR